MSSKPITVRMPDPIFARLESYVRDVGSSKTEVVLTALSQYLGVAQAVPLSEKVAQLEKRVAVLEQKSLATPSHPLPFHKSYL